MWTPPGRRQQQERRGDIRLPEALERTGQRRQEERRESVRVRRPLTVHLPGGQTVTQGGEVGLGGASWRSPGAPPAGEVEVCFRLPDLEAPVRARACVQAVHPVGSEVEVHVRFITLALKEELALARFLEARGRLVASLHEPRGAP
jgi:hypothetical protein